jgi:hypothetical protein
MSLRNTPKACLFLSVIALGALSACGGATRSAPTPQGPGTAALTGAKVAPRIERVLVADRGLVAMVARDGCLATISTADLEAGSSDELRVRCPRPERMSAWFAGVDRLTASVALEPTDEDMDEDDVSLPSAELVTASGKLMHVVQARDAARLLGEVRALTAELASAEIPAPGPTTPAGWQMLRVSGPARVFFAGSPARGVLDARVSTTGQYFCDFLANTDEGPMRATKSGWIAPSTASKAIDEVLQPFEGLGEAERPASDLRVGDHRGRRAQGVGDGDGRGLRALRSGARCSRGRVPPRARGAGRSAHDALSINGSLRDRANGPPRSGGRRSRARSSPRPGPRERAG